MYTYREKLYRAKSSIKDDDNWYFGSLITTHLNQKVLRFDGIRETNYVPVKEETICELVGRYGPKKIPVFEGDRITLGTKNEYVIVWSQESLAFILIGTDGSEQRLTEKESFDKIRVISNIIERPLRNSAL